MAASMSGPSIDLMLPRPGKCDVVLDRSPVLTVHALIMEAIRGGVSNRPQLHGAVLEALGGDGLKLYTRVRTGPDRLFYPSAIIPQLDEVRDWPKAAGERIADLGPDALVEQIVTMQLLRDGASWLPVLEDPRRWLTGVARAFSRVAAVVRPWWQRATPRLAVEEARLELVGSTVEGRRRLVNEMSSSVCVDHDALRVRWSQSGRARAREQILLSPMVVSTCHTFLVTDTAAGTVFGYPMGAAFRLPADDVEPRGRLDALLGEVRAQVLRHLGRPCTFTALADQTGTAVSTMSHHVDKMIEDGLVVTMRLGRSNWVIRTVEGDRVLELFG